MWEWDMKVATLQISFVLQGIKIYESYYYEITIPQYSIDTHFLSGKPYNIYARIIRPLPHFEKKNTHASYGILITSRVFVR